MRIDAYNQINQIYGINGRMKTSKVNTVSKKDQLEISSMGRDIQIAKKAVADSPDVREDKVADLKKRIDNGTYDVSTDSFADMLLRKFSEI